MMLDRLEAISNASNNDELAGFNAKYGTIILSGFVENKIREILGDYCATKTNHTVLLNVMDKATSLQNPDTGRITKLLQKFNKTWANEFTRIVGDEGKAAINSVVGTRHTLAHGGTASTTWNQLKKWRTTIESALKSLEDFILLQK